MELSIRNIAPIKARLLLWLLPGRIALGNGFKRVSPPGAIPSRTLPVVNRAVMPRKPHAAARPDHIESLPDLTTALNAFMTGCI